MFLVWYNWYLWTRSTLVFDLDAIFIKGKDILKIFICWYFRDIFFIDNLIDLEPVYCHILLFFITLWSFNNLSIQLKGGASKLVDICKGSYFTWLSQTRLRLKGWDTSRCVWSISNWQESQMFSLYKASNPHCFTWLFVKSLLK